MRHLPQQGRTTILDREDGSEKEVVVLPPLGQFHHEPFWSYFQLGSEAGRRWLVPAVWAYQDGRYEEALDYLADVFAAAPEVEPTLSIYRWTCERVLATPSSEGDLAKRQRHEEWEQLAPWRRWRQEEPAVLIRCKWCGHLTAWISPHHPSFFGRNACGECESHYPAPDFGWDSLRGMAYCARQSWNGTNPLPRSLWSAFIADWESKHGPTDLDLRRGDLTS
jgi:hypothetical protein